ncbi:MAG: DUF305 domain-containing protein [Actinobacteria bacterium]|jgi:uncharacterized protein (DUF305 family)|nr:DUF305 domain-containing protein [Actinomycetota bacterium]NBP91052.1 DUF305 domain-containing protein [Actinomycetota bacterium]
MQINIDKKSGILLAVIAILLAVIGAILIDQRTQPQDRGRVHHNGHDDVMSMNSTQSNNASAFQGNDIMFAQMMIPHHEQAVELSNLALLTSKNTEILALAESIRDAQSPEIMQMKSWLTLANAPTEMGHTMSEGMGGMLSETELANLKKATGNIFDKLFLTGMIAHHEGAIHMTMMIRDSANVEVKNLGEKIVASQSSQITQMQKMLANLK